MKLVSVKFENFRTLKDTLLEVHEEITCIAGQNDAGKTSILDAIELALRPNVMQPHDVNRDFDRDYTGKDIRRPIYTHFDYEVDPQDPIPYFSTLQQATGGGIVSVSSKLNHPTEHPDRCKARRVRNSAGEIVVDQTITRLSRVIRLDRVTPLPNVIHPPDANNQNTSEGKLYRLLVGRITRAQIDALPIERFIERIVKGADTFNQMLKENFEALNLELVATANHSDRTIAIMLRDSQRIIGSLESRGAGIRRIIALLTELVDERHNKEDHYLVLFDEPETSLHPSAQQTLRIWLEILAKDPHIQVIIATHAPRMLNMLRGSTMRLIERAENSDHSQIKNSPVDQNRKQIRDALGTSLVDSMLIGEINLLFEGKTEDYCFEPVFKRMSSLEAYPDALARLGSCNLMPCGGSTFKQWVTFVRALHGKLLVFADGDVDLKPLIKANTLTEDELVQLPKDKVFENLVDEDVYMNAFQSIVGDDDSRVTAAAFFEYRKSAENKGHKRTLKAHIAEWLKSLKLDTNYPKHKVMLESLKKATDRQIDWKLLAPLLIRLRSITGDGAWTTSP